MKLVRRTHLDAAGSVPHLHPFLSSTETLLVASSLLLGVSAVTSSTGPACRLSEFGCNSGRCVGVNRFCDQRDDCGDSSDEPRFCTPCNRTYYGDVGKTYELELHRPREDRLPYVCQLTFTAGGGDLGDIVQLTFDSFTLGRFTSFTTSGCPDGAMHMSEAGRPRMGGAWCGPSWGAHMYYSETRSVTLDIGLRRMVRDSGGFSFDFRLGYKMLPRGAAVVRYGGAPPPTAPYYLGELIPGTYCSRIFSDCDRRPCRLQSPNYPGVYPRNVTCYYAVRQHEVAAGRHALIVVRQPEGQLVAVRSQPHVGGGDGGGGGGGAASGEQQLRRRELKVWGECDAVQDYVTVYDGYTTRDPVLLRFCGGGDRVPEAASSGPELLVEFTSSAFGTLAYPGESLGAGAGAGPGSARGLHGFQLEVEVVLVPQESNTYARHKRCWFTIEGPGRGVLESPRHSLARNTTCTYLLHVSPHVAGAQHHRVWLSVLKFHVGPPLGDVPSGEEDCSAQLLVWDGVLGADDTCAGPFCDRESPSRSPLSSPPPSPSPPPPLLARFCKDSVPKSCDHTLLANTTRRPRPCGRSESFLSSGPGLSLELRTTESTALRPVIFRALYEFVDLRQDGEPLGSGACSRRFESRTQNPRGASPWSFRSPRDVFLFGRGGASTLSCVYRFVAQSGERVKLVVTSLSTGGRPCRTPLQPDLGRFECRPPSHAPASNPGPATLRVYEMPWHDAPPLARDCLCSSDAVPFTFVSTSHVVEVRFHVDNMSTSEDFTQLAFEGTWQIFPTPVCGRRQRLSGPSGEIRLRFPSRTPEEVNCEKQPWLLQPGPGRFLYVKLRGLSVHEAEREVEAQEREVEVQEREVEAQERNRTRQACSTRNRIAVQSGDSVRVLICPQPSTSPHPHVVEVFSEGWLVASGAPAPLHTSPHAHTSVIVEFLAREAGMYSLTWLELARRRSVLPPAGFMMDDCPHRCPELDACINASLWCDGVPHCPSAFDEAVTHCSPLLRLPLAYLAVAAAALLLVASSVCALSCSACRRGRRGAGVGVGVGVGAAGGAAGGKDILC